MASCLRRSLGPPAALLSRRLIRGPCPSTPGGYKWLAVSHPGRQSLARGFAEARISLPQARRAFSSEPDLFGDKIIVTKSCAKRINELRVAKGEPKLRLRLAVEGGGCSGFQYAFTVEGPEAPFDPDEDLVFERDGAEVVVDETSMELVRGATIDFAEDMMRSAFQVLNNPNSEMACGCGSSFAAKAFAANPAVD